MTQIIPTAEPFFFPGAKGAPGVLLVHGFTGTPKEMRWMGETLNKDHGFHCLGVRLTGHATRPEDMIRSRYTDWLESVEDGFNLLSGVTEQIFLAGLSMGGVLSLTMAARLPVHGVIAMATPYSLPNDPRLRHIDWLAKIVPFMPKSNNAPGEGWFDKEAFHSHISYPENPVASIGQFNQLLGEMRESLPKITAPVLLIYSKDDDYIPLGSEFSLEHIYENIGSARKEKLMLKGSGHVLTRDAQRETVFSAAAAFIQSA